MSTKSLLALIPLLLAVHLSGAANAQCEIAHLSPHTPRAGQAFGGWTVIDGDTAVVSARGDLAVPQAGSVYVYARTGTAWIEQQELTASDGQVGDNFGTMVSISGDTIAVGSFGKAYVFVERATGWIEQQILALPGLGANEHFGTIVDLDGNTLVVGAQREGVPGPDSGAAYVFVRDVAGAWSLQQRLQPANPAAGDVTGFAVLEGNMLLLGSPGKDGHRGAIYRFTRSGNIWTQREKITASDGQPDDHFGTRFSLDGDTLLVSALLGLTSFAEDNCAIYVLARSGVTFVEQQRIDLRAPGLASWWNTPTAISGDTFVATAPLEDLNGPSSGGGAAYVFTRSGSIWTQSARLVATSSAPNRGFGWGQAVSNGTILIGASGDDTSGNDAGLVHVYQVLGSTVLYHNGRGVNVDTLTTTPVTTGQTWTATLGVAAPHARGLGFVAVQRTTRAGTLVLAGRAEYLLGGPRLGILGPLAHFGQGSSLPFQVQIPASLALIGSSWAAQGVVTGGQPGLTNAAAGLVR